MKKIYAPLLIVILSFVFISCSDKTSSPGRAFEGKIIQKVTINASAISELAGGDSAREKAPNVLSSMGINTTVIMYVKPDKLAYDMSLGGFINMHAIIDPMTRKMTMIMGKIAYQTDLKKLDGSRKKIDDSLNAHPDIFDSLGKMMPKPTGKKEEINGFDCEQYVMTVEKDGKKMEMESWITTDPRLKFYEVIKDALLGKGRTGGGGMEQLFSTFDSFSGEGKVAVKMTMKVNGKEFMTTELTDMVEEKLDNSLFEVPSDVKIMKEDDMNVTMPKDSI